VQLHIGGWNRIAPIALRFAGIRFDRAVAARRLRGDSECRRLGWLIDAALGAAMYTALMRRAVAIVGQWRRGMRTLT
jgi:hypothetical protein